ncbi:hypothetical protein [Leisingera aquimarina]|nr:hypothetical protein [Leisingera aquimarina]
MWPPTGSIEVAAEWRSKLAPLDGGSEMPARFNASATMAETLGMIAQMSG